MKTARWSCREERKTNRRRTKNEKQNTDWNDGCGGNARRFGGHGLGAEWLWLRVWWPAQIGSGTCRASEGVSGEERRRLSERRTSCGLSRLRSGWARRGWTPWIARRDGTAQRRRWSQRPGESRQVITPGSAQAGGGFRFPACLRRKNQEAGRARVSISQKTTPEMTQRMANQPQSGMPVTSGRRTLPSAATF